MATADVGETLARFSKSRQLLRDVYSSSKVQFNQIQNILKDEFLKAEVDEDIGDSLLSPQDIERLDAVTEEDPVIIVSGQVNCGKTSLLNELLGGSYLPTAVTPCTARAVQIHYSDVNYVQVFDAEGNPLMERIHYSSKKVPEEHIALKDSRDGAAEVECLVKVGLNNELLKNGIQLMDVPGLYENDPLDNLVTKTLGGLLKLVVYVIDGKKSLTLDDKAFLNHLKTTSPNAQIMFVCNKVEDDEEALQMDRFSDDSGTDEERPDRAKLAFMKLKRAQLLPSDSVYRTDMENYHGLSCTQIRKNRLKKGKSNEFSKSFDRFKVSLLNTLAGCVNSHLSKAVIELLQCQRRLFDFGIAGKNTKLPRMGLRQHVKFIISQETEFHKQLLHRIHTNWTPITYRALVLTMENETEGILEAVQTLEFQPITLTDEPRAEDIVHACRLQVRDYVLALVIERFAEKLKVLEGWLSHEVEHVRKGIKHGTSTGTDSGVENLLRNQLAQIWGRAEIKLDMEAVKYVWVAGLCVSVKAKLEQLREDIKLRMGGIYLDEKWKKNTAEAVLRNINLESLTSYIIRGVENSLNKDQEYFLFAMRQIVNLCKLKETQAQDSKKLLKEMIPSYSKNLCVTEALATTLKYGAVSPQQKFAEGSRCEIFECSEYKNEQNLVVKKTRTDPEQPSEDVCPSLCYTRLMTPIKEHSTVVAVAFDSQWQFCIVQKKYGKNLFAVLSSEHNLSLEDRLTICLKVAAACDNAAKHGIRLNDLRPNNIFIEQSEPWNEKGQEEGVSVVLNIHKWKDLNAPYPDGKPPFHFAPEVAMSQKANEENFETYSLTVLLVQLVLGRIVRPPFSETETAHKEVQQSDNYIRALCEQFLELWEQNWEERESRVFKLMKSLINKYIGCEPTDRMGLQTFLADIKRFKSTMNETEPDPSSLKESMEADRKSSKREKASAVSSPAPSNRGQAAYFSRGQTSPTRGQRSSKTGSVSPKPGQRSQISAQKSPTSRNEGLKSPKSCQRSAGKRSLRNANLNPLSADQDPRTFNYAGQLGATQFYTQGSSGQRVLLGRSRSADPGLPPSRPKAGPSSAPHAPPSQAAFSRGQSSPSRGQRSSKTGSVSPKPGQRSQISAHSEESMEESYGDASPEQVVPHVMTTLEQARSKSLAASGFAAGNQPYGQFAQNTGVIHHSSVPEMKAKMSDRKSARFSQVSSNKGQTGPSPITSSMGQTSPIRGQRSSKTGQLSAGKTLSEESEPALSRSRASNLQLRGTIRYDTILYTR